MQIWDENFNILKTMTFCRQEPIRSKTAVNNKIIQANTFKYLRCSMSYGAEKL
jgi:hypothetical protein